MSPLSFCSWNICGVNKLTRYPVTLRKILSHDVILLQESLQLAPNFSFDGCSRFDVAAKPTGGRASGGLVTLFGNSHFRDFTFSLLCEEEHLLLILAATPSLRILVGNVYIPRSSGG